MNIFIYIMIFIMGTVFGSFFSLAIYRIPRKENITYVQSHCVSCNHKLGFWDLIPIFSYLFLGGKCRYCKEKIRSRYVLLEITSGITFLLVALFLNINVYSTIVEFINLFITYLFIVAVYIIGGIDKEKYIIPDGVILYSICVCFAKLLLNGYMGVNVINNLIGFLAIPLVLLIIDLVFKLDKNNNFPIGFGDIKYLASIGLFLGFASQIIIIPISLIIAFIGNIFHKYKEIPFGYYISIATILFLIFGGYISEVLNLISIG